jgi:hypothetical protein
MGLPERLQHLCGASPIFEADECDPGVVFRSRANLGGRGGLRNAKEVIGRRAIVAREVGLFALLVDRRCEVVDDRLEGLGARGGHLDHTLVGLLCVHEVDDVEEGVGDGRPRGTENGRVRLRIGLDQPLTRGDRTVEFIHVI